MSCSFNQKNNVGGQFSEINDQNILLIFTIQNKVEFHYIPLYWHFILVSIFYIIETPQHT